MNKQNQSQLTRAHAQGPIAYMRALAVIHRCSGTRTQREIDAIIRGDAIGAPNLSAQFIRRNGALIHRSEA